MNDDHDDEDYREDWDGERSAHLDSLSEIIPGFLYLSNYKAANRLDLLKQHNITKVISIGGMEDHTHYALHEEHSIEYLFVYIDDHDDEPISNHFEECIEFIGAAAGGGRGGGTLVHCWAGISRSATIVIAYLMAAKGMTCYEAYDYVKERRCCINPNDGFCEQLKSFI